MAESSTATPIVSKATVVASKITTLTASEHTLRAAAGKPDPKSIVAHVDTETVVIGY